MENEVVWLKTQRRFAFLVSKHAYFSVVSYTGNQDSLDCFIVENDDYDIWSERAIEFEPDE